MTLSVVARKDFQDAVRSKLLWALSALFVLFAAGIAYAYATIDFFRNGPLSVLGLVNFIQAPTSVFVAVAAVAVGYRAIAGERETGSAKLLLSLPHSRRNVLLGKVVGRTGVLAVPILIGFAIAALVVLALYNEIAVAEYVAYLVATLLYALAFVSITVGISATTGSTTLAGVGAFGFWAVFYFLWNYILLLVYYVVSGFTLNARVFASPPDWFRFLLQITPSSGYGSALVALTSQSAPGTDVFYAQGWFGFVVLAFWIVVPLAVGYWRFDAADL